MENNWKHELGESGINEEIIALNFKWLEGATIYEYLAVGCQKRTNTGKLPNAWLRLYEHCEDGGWWVSGIRLTDFQPCEWGQFKPINPRADEYGIKPIKYEAPKGIPTEIFALRVGEKSIKAIAQRIDHPAIRLATPETFWQTILESDIPIVISEGAKKAAALLSAGYPAIALPGIWNAVRKDAGGIIPSLAPIASCDRPIYFAFDQDTKDETIANVRKAIKRIATEFERAGCACFIIDWDADLAKGIDDFLAHEGVEAFDERFANAHRFQTFDPTTDAIAPFTERAFQELYSEGSYACIGGELHRFNGRYYSRCDVELEKRRIRDWAMRNPEEIKGRWVLVHLSKERITSIWDYACLSLAVPSNAINPPGLNLANGILRLKWKGRSVNWELIEHSPKAIYTYCSDVRFDPTADPTDCDRLLSALDPPEQTIWLRTIAASLDLERVRSFISRIRILLLFGTGSNGKDSLRAAVKEIFGDRVVAATFSDFQQYDSGKKFPLAKLADATVNWASENSKFASLDGLESLKALITGDELWIEQKNRDEYPIKGRAVCLFNINRYPSLNAGLDAIISRYGILTFKKTFKFGADASKWEIEADARFHDDPKFLTEKVCPALLNRILAELRLLIEKGIDYGEITDSLAAIQEETTHLWAFAHESGLTDDPGGKTYIGDLWARLEAWYIENGTLEITTDDNGKQRRVWHDQVNGYDANVKAPNQITRRFAALFPKIKRLRETADEAYKGQFYLSGIAFKGCESNPQTNIGDIASLASLPYTASDTASPIASLSFTEQESASLNKEGGGEAVGGIGEAISEAIGEATALAQQESEAVKQSPSVITALENPRKRKLKTWRDQDELLEEIYYYQEALHWSAQQLREFARDNLDNPSISQMNQGELHELSRLLKLHL